MEKFKFEYRIVLTIKTFLDNQQLYAEDNTTGSPII